MRTWITEVRSKSVPGSLRATCSRGDAVAPPNVKKREDAPIWPRTKGHLGYPHAPPTVVKVSRMTDPSGCVRTRRAGNVGSRVILRARRRGPPGTLPGLPGSPPSSLQPTAQDIPGDCQGRPMGNRVSQRPREATKKARKRPQAAPETPRKSQEIFKDLQKKKKTRIPRNP